MGKKLLYVYEKIEDTIASIGLICGVSIVFIGVVARYVFGHPLTFVDEIGPIFIVWSTLVGYSIALRKDEHIKMDILYVSVKSEKVKKAMDIFSYLCGMLFSLFMMVYGFKAMQMQYMMNRVTQIMEFPVWLTYLIIPVVGLVLVIRYIALMLHMLKKSDEPSIGTGAEEE